MKKVRNTIVVSGVVLSLLGGVLLPVEAGAATKTAVVNANDFTQQRAALGKEIGALDKKLDTIEGETFRVMVDRVLKLHAVKGSSVEGSLKKARLEGARIGSSVSALRGQLSFLKVDAMTARDTSDFDRVRSAVALLQRKIVAEETSLYTFKGSVNILERSVAVQNASQLKKFDQSARGAFESRSVRNLNYADLLDKLRADYMKKKKTTDVRNKLLKEAEAAFKASNRAMVSEGLAAMSDAYEDIYTGDFASAHKELLVYAKTKRVKLIEKYTADQQSIYKKYTKR